MALKQTSEIIAIGFSIDETAANTFTQVRVDLQLNPLDNEVFVVSAFDVLAVSSVLELIPLADPAPAGVVTASDWASVITAMTSQISVSTVVGVLATLVTAGIGLVFLWWGVRKAVGSLMGSFRSGRIRL